MNITGHTTSGEKGVLYNFQINERIVLTLLHITELSTRCFHF